MSVSAISASIIKTGKKVDRKTQKEWEFHQVSYIQYPALFSEFSIETLIDLGRKIIVMKPNFERKLGFCIYITNIDTPKIDGDRLKVYEIIIRLFQVDIKDKKFCFFKKIFLLADISIHVTFRIFSLTLNIVKVNLNN